MLIIESGWLHRRSRNHRAMVLGAGSGRSAGTVAQAFARVDVVDIGATVPELLAVLAPENFEVLKQPGVS